MEDADIFYWHLVYFTAIWCTYCIGIWYIFGNLVIFPLFGMLYQEKSGNPAYKNGSKIQIFA
jgi:thiol-disulfide isomerase/thioredoxin